MDTAFTPVPVRARRDGWTPARQAAFIAAISKLRCVAAACRLVGLSFQSAYRLRERHDATSFAAAWDRVFAFVPRPSASAALDGVATPITYRGKQVGERRRYNHRLAKYILAIRAPDRFGAAAGAEAAPPRDTAADLHDALVALAADLARGIAPLAEAVSASDVVRSSSPFVRPDRRSSRRPPSPSAPVQPRVRRAP